jgi:hypothetical protein
MVAPAAWEVGGRWKKRLELATIVLCGAVWGVIIA